MKFVEFSGATGSVAANNWTYFPMYKNNTSSYILVLGLSYIISSPPNLAPLPFTESQTVVIIDPNGNVIDTVQVDSVIMTNQNGSIPVWNGTSVVQETATFPKVNKVSISRVGSVMIPPQCTLAYGVYTTVAGNFSINGGWGLALDTEEVLAFQGTIKKNAFFKVEL